MRGGATRPPDAARTPLVLLNPAAGAGRAAARLARLEPWLRAWPAPPEIVSGRSLDHLRGVSALAREEARPLVVAAGGDGTVHAVANGLLAGAGPLPELGYLPLGTSGDFGRSLGLPTPAHRVARGIPGWSAWPIDVGVAVFDAGPTEVFLNCANLGLAVHVAGRVDRSPALQRLGRFAYAAAALLELRHLERVRLRVRLDEGQARDLDLVHLSVANGPSFGGGLRPIPEASLSSGRLHTLELGDLSPARAVVELARALAGRAPTHGSARRAAPLRVRIEGDAGVELDGQLPGRLPATFEVRPGALRVRCPAPSP